MMAIDLLIGLMVTGLIAAVTFATLPLGAFAIDPIAINGKFLFSLAYFVFRLRPEWYMMGAFRKKNQGGSGNTVAVENNSVGFRPSEPSAGRYM